MMTIDTIASFKILKQCGIRVARSKFVDSAEDAIAFAERRTAADPRFLPIMLRAEGGTETSPASRPLQTEAEIRGAFAALARKVGAGKILAQGATDSGTDVAIDGRVDPERGKVIALKDAAHGIESMIPLASAGAENLALHFRAHHHHGSSEKEHRMLEHLLLRISAFFDTSEFTAFHLGVRLHENSYTVFAASINSPKALHLKERLQKRAHDRKGDEYRPAGRQ